MFRLAIAKLKKQQQKPPETFINSLTKSLRASCESYFLHAFLAPIFNTQSAAKLCTERVFTYLTPLATLKDIEYLAYLSIIKGMEMFKKIKKAVKNWVLKACISCIANYGDMTFESCKSTTCFLASFLPVRWREDWIVPNFEPVVGIYLHRNFQSRFYSQLLAQVSYVHVL